MAVCPVSVTHNIRFSFFSRRCYHLDVNNGGQNISHLIAKHFDDLPNVVFVLLLVPKQLWPIEAWVTRPLKLCCVICTNMLATHPLNPVSCEVPCIGLVCPAHSTDARLDWDLGNLEAESTPYFCAPQTVTNTFLSWCSCARCCRFRRWIEVSVTGTLTGLLLCSPIHNKLYSDTFLSESAFNFGAKRATVTHLT